MPLRTWERNNWLILDSNTLNVRWSAAIHSCPWEIVRKWKTTGLSSTAIHQMYAGRQPSNHALDRLYKCRKTGLTSTAIHRMYAGVKPYNHALENLRSYVKQNNWLILDSDTSNARRSEAIQSCPWELEIVTNGLSSTAIHRMYAGVQPFNHALERSYESENHWLILDSDTSNVRRSAAIQSCPWELEIVTNGLFSTAIHRMYTGVQPFNHALENLRSYEVNVQSSSTAIHQMYAEAKPSKHALEIVQECNITQQQKTKEWNIFRL